MPTPSKPTTTTFGKRLRELRRRAGLSQEKLGVAIGLDEGVATVRIGRYETGVHEPSNAVAGRLAQALGVLPSYFHCEDENLAEVIMAWAKLSKPDQSVAKDFVLGLAARK